MYTAILGTENEKKAALSLSRILKQNGQIIIDNHFTIMQNNASDDPIAGAKNLSEYVRKDSTTCLIILSSATLCDLLAKDDAVSLQINGNSIVINTGSFKQLVCEELKSKIILVIFSTLPACIPECFKGCEELILSDCNPEVEISKISLMKLQSALKRRNKELGMHQS